jgi:CheY-like chemotaxis protein
VLVEDDFATRVSLADLLTYEGYEVVSAADGIEGFELVSRTLPNLVLLDLGMPGIDGLEFRARQLADPVLVNIPVIVITGRSLGQAARLLEDVFVLAKPFDLEALLGLVGTCLEDSEGRARWLDEEPDTALSERPGTLVNSTPPP